MRAVRRKALDRYFARATGQEGSGLADYVQRLRAAHQVVIDSDGTYRGCACGDLVCGKDLLMAWCDEGIVSYERKVQDFAGETLRYTRLRAAVESFSARVRQGSADGSLDRATEWQIAMELDAILEGTP